ncbi:PAS domain-containing protein [Rhodovibrio salinarum]|uniref:PAS domain-containing protein n=1 Tax=Rhodovibrio salinarum TaxID=1087 RepID=UPI0004848104|nr:PAS domain-containing protein [Rhodovibrio salinarum]
MPNQACPIQSSALRAVARWWISAYTPDRLPSRREIDLDAIRHALPYVWLVEHVPDDESFRYRLSGEHVNVVFGFSLRGKRLCDIIEPHMLDTVRQRYLHVLNTPGVVYAVGRVYMRIGGYREGERLILPLSDDGVKATHLFGVTDYGGGRRENWEQPPEYMDERFLEIDDVRAWGPALSLDDMTL